MISKKGYWGAALGAQPVISSLKIQPRSRSQTQEFRLPILTEKPVISVIFSIPRRQGTRLLSEYKTEVESAANSYPVTVTALPRKCLAGFPVT